MSRPPTVEDAVRAQRAIAALAAGIARTAEDAARRIRTFARRLEKAKVRAQADAMRRAGVPEREIRRCMAKARNRKRALRRSRRNVKYLKKKGRCR